MPLLDQIRADKLIELAQAHFDPKLSDAELKVLRDSAISYAQPYPDESAPRPEVRAEFLRWLASDPDAAPHIAPKGLRVYAATISGNLDVQECKVSCTLFFCRSTFQGVLGLKSAETRGIYFLDSSLAQGMSADGVIIHGPLYLQRTQSEGDISLVGAEIAGDLDCSGAILKATGRALTADGARIGGSVFLYQDFESEGGIRLLGAQITGDLVCSGAKLHANENALFADRAKIGGGVLLDQRFESEGEIRLLGAQIAGELTCNGANLKARGNALSADGARIGGGVLLNQGFHSEGTIRLPGAQITENLECDGANLKARGTSLLADGAKIGGGVFLRDHFEAEGVIRLLAAAIGHDLTIDGAKVAAVSCQNTVVNGDLYWQGIKNPRLASLILIGAKVKNLHDDRESWPAAGNLYLEGLAYEELTLHRRPSQEQIENSLCSEELELKVEDRIDWLMRQPENELSNAQPWMQLSKYMEGKGDPDGAKHVLFKYKCLLVTREWPLWRWVRVAFFRLEENPLRIAWSIAFTLLIGWLIFGFAGAHGLLAPTDADADKAFRAKTNLPAGYPELNTLAYTFENAVPLVKLGQDAKWAPDRSWFPKQSSTGYWFLVCTRWALILSGWFQGAVLGAALLGRFKK